MSLRERDIMAAVDILEEDARTGCPLRRDPSGIAPP
jgi:hypothetical protein